MSKLNWSMASKEVMIKNIAKAERDLQSARGQQKKKLARYISYMKSALRRKGFEGPVNTLQPLLAGFQSAVEVPDFSQAMLEKVVKEVVGKLVVSRSFSGIKDGKFFIKGKEVNEEAYTAYVAGINTHLKRLQGLETSKEKEMPRAIAQVAQAKRRA